ncbi:glycosyltransferase family 4 protein [Candidatus Dojkabacteria bacterium]|nr:glycosyltransferase family 4 protein [Candidatus Dojkabacteria bacterium]
MKTKLRIALVSPHIFMHQDVLDKTIFAPASLFMDLTSELSKNHLVTSFTPGPINTKAQESYHVSLRFLEQEARKLNCSFPDLIKYKPLTFITLARQAACEVVAKAYQMANKGKFDIVHIFTIEEEFALYFAPLVKIPVIFTHHDPYNMYARYRARFPNVENLNYISISNAQRKTATRKTNFITTIYNGINFERFKFNFKPKDYFVYYGRIVKNKGCHIAISVCKKTGNKLKIAGKHYQGHGDENYWDKSIKPHLRRNKIEYAGFIKDQKKKNSFLGEAKALLLPVKWEEPFGLVIPEANACGTPVIAFKRGSIPELIKEGINGFIVENENQMMEAMKEVNKINREKCREYAFKRFSMQRMAQEYEEVYLKIIEK